MSENQNIQSGSIIALSSLQPFVITSGEPEMRVWLYRIDPFTGVKSLLFSSVLSLKMINESGKYKDSKAIGDVVHYAVSKADKDGVFGGAVLPDTAA